MMLKMFNCLCISLCVFVTVCYGSRRQDMNVGKTNEKDVDVKPGGETHEFKEKWGDVTCKFTYECQGGTNEKWALTMVKNSAGTEYACAVERPSGVSYLFFEKFELELHGASTKEVLVIGENGKELMPSEYVHKKKESKVMWEKDFRSHLTKVEIYGTVGKHKEL